MTHLDSTNKEHRKFCRVEHTNALFRSDYELGLYCLMFQSNKKKNNKKKFNILFKEKITLA